MIDQCFVSDPSLIRYRGTCPHCSSVSVSFTCIKAYKTDGIKPGLYRTTNLATAIIRMGSGGKDEFKEFRAIVVCGQCDENITLCIAYDPNKPFPSQKGTHKIDFSASDPLPGYVLVGTYPKINIGDIPKHTPDHISASFAEVIANIEDGRNRSAGMLARTTLEEVLNDLMLEYKLVGNIELAQKMTAADRLKRLGEAGIIPKEINELASKVRLDGNHMTHRADWSSISAHEMAEFVELILTYVYTIKTSVNNVKLINLDVSVASK